MNPDTDLASRGETELVNSLIRDVTFQSGRLPSTLTGKRERVRASLFGVFHGRIVMFFAGVGIAALGSSLVQANAATLPHPLPYPAPIVPPRDMPFNGAVTLAVDATDRRTVSASPAHAPIGARLTDLLSNADVTDQYNLSIMISTAASYPARGH